ncbi:MAG: hypothetical protein AB7P31_12485 [Steroidobacteraceae bacterium]
MYINIWSSPLLAGLSRGWGIWYEAMARSQDFSAPWRTDAARRAAAPAAAPARREIGRYESLSATK